MKIFRSLAIFLISFCGLIERGPAHDLWIEPSDFFPAIGQRISIRLRVGEKFVGDLLPRSLELIDRFVLVGPDNTVPILGVEGGDPAGYTQAATGGVRVIGYQSHPFRVDVEPAKFEGYLVEEGLDMISFLRQQRGTMGTPGIERFSRCAKALISTGTETFNPDVQPLNFILELHPEIETFPLRTGERLSVQLRYHGETLAGALVKAFPRDHPHLIQSARSDREGKATFDLNEPGMWLIKVVHMIEADSEVDWESFWASLTFEVIE